MNAETLKPMVEAILMASDAPVSLERLVKLLEEEEPKPTKDEVGSVISQLRSDYDDRGVELVEVASGFRFQARAAYGERVSRLWEERRPRYSRALLETLAIIAYRQPITRGEIEHIRGVAVSTGIMRTLLEREWVRVVGHRDVPGRPSVYATTKEFLDYFGMTSLDELPSLAELKDIEDINPDLFAGLEAQTADDETAGDTDDEASPAAAADESEAPGSAHGAEDPAVGEPDEGAVEDDDVSEAPRGSAAADDLDDDGTGLAAAPPDAPR